MPQLRDFITVAPRYTRSIQLERDASVPGAIDGYVVTTTAQRVLHRLGRAMVEPAGHRAWTLTGPYGSGKSAFGLYLSHLLGPADTEGGKLARNILKSQQVQIYQDLMGQKRGGVIDPAGFCSVLVSGASESLLGALLRACCRDLRTVYSHGRRPNALKELEALHSAFQQGVDVSSTAVTEALSRLCLHLQKHRKSQGVLLIIDELGKFLEFAARDPKHADIYVLQQLAEATAGFNPPCLFVITILHQSFERYAANLRPSAREEWAKIQGRFEDVAFQEPPEQLLELIAAAIQHTKSTWGSALEIQAQKLAEEAVRLSLVPRGMSDAEFLRTMQASAPLHPLTSLALVGLCRKFGQNQRSLFAFLVSREAHGFANFLLQEATEPLPFLGLAELYDYVSEALGNGLGVGEGSERWAQVQIALERCLSSSPDEIRLIKILGLLSAIGAHGSLKPSREILRFAFSDDRAFQSALDAFLERSIVIERKHNDTFALWEGSDIDLDERVQEAARHVPDGHDLAQRISTLRELRPLVAKRHSFETGTLRYFSVRYADVKGFERGLEPDAAADGLIFYCLPNNENELQQFIHLMQEPKVRERQDILVAVSQDVSVLRKSIRELELLRWVQTNTPELQADAVARRELRSRISVVDSEVSKEVECLFSPDEQGSTATHWYYRGVRRPIHSTRALGSLLSDICSNVYSHTPKLRNELINRRQLSSATAGARRNLLDAMVTRVAEPRLGIEGTPPEFSIYASVLHQTGIHRQEAGIHGFREPTGDPALLAVWQEIRRFFSRCEAHRRPVAELFALLQRPPYGLKMGVIPILFCAVSLAHDTEVAFYENGAFLPALTIEVLERLIRSPEKFELRHYRVEGVRREVFRQMAKLFMGNEEPASEDLVLLMRPLFRFLNRLPAYSRQTKSLSPTAIAVRDALFNSKEPDQLLFSELPKVCGTEPFLASSERREDLGLFLKTLQTALGDLQRAYDDLLGSLKDILFQGFHLDGGEKRTKLGLRAEIVSGHCLDARLKAFAFLLAERQPDDGAWIEAIATMVIGKPPKSWNDTDRQRFEVGSAELVRSFRHLEAVVFEVTKRAQGGRSADHVLRIAVSDRNDKERAAVVVVEKHERKQFDEAVRNVKTAVERSAVSGKPELVLAALAAVSKQYLAALEMSAVEKPFNRAEGGGPP